MKRLFLILVLVFNSSCARRIAMEKPALYDKEWGDSNIVVPKSEMVDFINESYLYKIRWLGLTVAEAEFENLGIEDYKGRECYHVVIKARTHKVLNFIFSKVASSIFFDSVSFSDSISFSI